MKSKKLRKSLETYGLIGKGLCACAGGIVGFILGGPFVAFVGILAGAIAGHTLEKILVKAPI